MDNLILLILGLFISVLGITNIKGNISTIHSYNRRKVKEEDKIPLLIKFFSNSFSCIFIIHTSLVLIFCLTGNTNQKKERKEHILFPFFVLT